ncbi:hypothetical protein ACVW0K_003379 [Streptomyces filamentosus]|uniref:hypothetical protein n=1 Tax=Streptomyces filamentosus TaxID=67294 RepID=UPI0036E2D3AD
MNDLPPTGVATVYDLPCSTWAAPEGAVHLSVRATDLHRRDDGWYGWVPLSALAHLADGPAAESALSSKRLYLQDSPENLRLAEMLRDRPEDFGGAGEPIVLWADHLAARHRRSDDRLILQLHGVHCVNGYQTLVTIARAGRTLGLAHLDRAQVLVTLYGGGPEKLARLQRLSHESASYANPVQAQDNLGRCPHLTRIAGKYRAEGITFDFRRGVVDGPHVRAQDISAVYRGLACLHPAPEPLFAHDVSTEEGLNTVWSDLDGSTYRALLNEESTEIGVQRAAEAYTIARDTIDKVSRRMANGHGLLLRYAPDLVVWTAVRGMPLERLHSDGPYVFAGTSDEQHREFSARVGETAASLVAAYEELRPQRPGESRRTYKGEADRRDVWLALVERLRRTGALWG